ncbi:MAG TPA: hypothetical protein VJH67_02095 [Candidatus Paceibacterota bacterium]
MFSNNVTAQLTEEQQAILERAGRSERGQLTQEESADLESLSARGNSSCDLLLNFNACVKQFLSGLAELLLTIGALILALAGNIFNLVLSFTIVEFAGQINNAEGLGGAINSAWSTLRDIGNIIFIFVLLWAGIQTILDIGGDLKKTIVNIILIGLIVNFSLFITKVVIDTSNIAAVGFYNSIMNSGEAGRTVPTITLAGIDFETRDFAGVFLRFTGVQSFFKADILTGANDDIWGKKPFVTGILGMITMIVMAIVLFVAAIMFLARFIILLFLMILSPVAFIAFILPAMRGKFKEWWDTLISQAFFAPYFMILIWVAFKVMAGASGAIGTREQSFAGIANSPFSAIGLVFNFALVMGLTIMALVLSKQLAGKTKGFGAVAGFVGGATIGVAGMAARQTVGRGSRMLLDSKYKDRLAKTSYGRGALWIANKGQKSSFDVRGISDSKLGKATGAKNLLGGIGDMSGKDGYKKAVEDNAKAKAQYAKDVYGSTAQEEKAHKDAKEKTKETKETSAESYKNAKGKEKSEAQNSVNEAENNKKKIEILVKEKREAHEKLGVVAGSPAEIAAKKELDEANVKLAEAETKRAEEMEKKTKIDEGNYSDATKELGKVAEEAEKAWKNLKSAGEARMREFADRVEKKNKIMGRAAMGGIIGGVAAGPLGAAIGAALGGVVGAAIKQGVRGNIEAARAIRKAAGGKTEEEEAAEILKKLDKKKKEAEGKSDEDKGEAKPKES